MWKKKPVTVDCGMLSFSVLKATEDPQKVRPAMDYSIALIRKNVNDYGMISYTGGRDNPEMYVDTLGMTCPFLALYARVYHDGQCEKLAINQLRMYHMYGLLAGTAIPNHAFHIKSKLPLGVYGWGRGTAWYLIGLMDTSTTDAGISIGSFTVDFGSCTILCCISACRWWIWFYSTA